MKFWHEILSKFFLDAARILLTTIIVGKFVIPDVVDYFTFWCSVIIFFMFVWASRHIAKKVES